MQKTVIVVQSADIEDLNKNVCYKLIKLLEMLKVYRY
jgi:hypothetical protein